MFDRHPPNCGPVREATRSAALAAARSCFALPKNYLRPASSDGVRDLAEAHGGVAMSSPSAHSWGSCAGPRTTAGPGRDCYARTMMASNGDGPAESGHQPRRHVDSRHENLRVDKATQSSSQS